MQSACGGGHKPPALSKAARDASSWRGGAVGPIPIWIVCKCLGSAGQPARRENRMRSGNFRELLPHIFHTLRPHAILIPLPLTDGPVNVPGRAGGRPSGTAVTCGGKGRRRCTGGFRWQQDHPERAPSWDARAGGSAKPATGAILAPCVRPAPTGCQGKGGNGPVAGRLADAGRVSGASLAALALPHRQREGQARVGECHKSLRPPVSGQPTSGTPPPVGRGHRPARLGPARVLRHPVHAPRMHTHTNHLQRRQPARGPPDPIFPCKPRRHPARDRRRPPVRKS